jgi:hypothetical protein
MVLALASAAAGAAACGGGGAAGPGPLRHMMDEVHIARVPVDQKPMVIQAQQDYNVARSERMTAETALSDLKTEIGVARNEVEAARLTESSARQKQQAAATSGDLNRKNQADAEMRAAELGRRAAEAKVEWLKAQEAYLKRWVRYTEHNMYAREAKFELEKRKTAQANNIAPQAVAPVAEFDKQYKERSEAAQRAKKEADDEKKRAEAKRKDWKKKESEWYAARGMKAPEEPTPANTDTLTTPTPTDTGGGAIR